MPSYTSQVFPNRPREIRCPLGFKVKPWTRCCHLQHTTSSWSIIILWVPGIWGQVYLYPNEKPQRSLVNRENGDFARKKSMFQFWCDFLSVLAPWEAYCTSAFIVLKGFVQDHCTVLGWGKPMFACEQWEKQMTRTTRERTEEPMSPHLSSHILEHTLFSNMFTQRVLIFFVATNVSLAPSTPKTFCSHFCAHPIYLLNRAEDISIFYIAHYNGWAFQAPLGVHCSYSFRASATTDYKVQNKMRPLLFML